MHFEFLVEEASLQVALDNLLPSILGEYITFQIHPYQGKKNMLLKLPGRLKGYKQWLPDDWRIVVLIDEDREDCIKLKQQLEDIAADVGLVTKTAAGTDRPFQVLNRLVIEELEAWFFGDVEAICAAYPRISPNLAQQAKYRNPDAVEGGTWEALERELKKKGYHPGGLSKLMAAREISQHMNPERNTSHSFQVFRDALLQMVQ